MTLSKPLATLVYLCFAVTIAHASLVTFTFTGQVTRVNDWGMPLPGPFAGVSANDSVTFEYTFDAKTPRQLGGTYDIGDYQNPMTGYTLAIGEVTITHTPAPNEFTRIIIYNQSERGWTDWYNVMVNIPYVNEWGWTDWADTSLSLYSSGDSSIWSDESLVTDLDLSDFDGPYQNNTPLRIRMFGGFEDQEIECRITGFTSSVPDPATLILLAAGTAVATVRRSSSGF